MAPPTNLNIPQNAAEQGAAQETHHNFNLPITQQPLGIIATTLTDFTGRDPARYLDKLEQRAKLDDWTEEITLKLLKFKFTGAAHDFFKSEPSLDGLNYSELKSKLLTKFSPKRLPGESLYKLSQCYQRHDEDVAAFCTRLRLLGAKALEDDLKGATTEEYPGIKKKNRELLLNQFKMGLKKDLLKETGVLLLKEEELNLEKAEALVALQETTMMMVTGKSSGQRVAFVEEKKTCQHCGKYGHLTRDCRSKPEKKNTADRPCFYCGRKGHWVQDCRTKKADQENTRDQHNNRSYYAPQRRENSPNRKSSYRNEGSQNLSTWGYKGRSERNTGAIPKNNYYRTKNYEERKQEGRNFNGNKYEENRNYEQGSGYYGRGDQQEQYPAGRDRQNRNNNGRNLN